MATIGTFTKSGDDFTGTVKTLALNVKAKIARAEKENDKAPDYRIFAGTTEFGAAWKKTSGAGREYLSVKLDDPSFPAPIFASLVATEGGDGLRSHLVAPQRRLSRVTAAPRPSGGALATRQFLSSRSTSFVIFASALSRFHAAPRRRASPVRRGSPRAHSQGDTTSRPSDCADHAQGR